MSDKEKTQRALDAAADKVAEEAKALMEKAVVAAKAAADKKAEDTQTEATRENEAAKTAHLLHIKRVQLAEKIREKEGLKYPAALARVKESNPELWIGSKK